MLSRQVIQHTVVLGMLHSGGAVYVLGSVVNGQLESLTPDGDSYSGGGTLERVICGITA